MIKMHVCPNCGSHDVYMVAGGTTGTWACKDCGYRGAVFEKEIIGKQQITKDKNKKIGGMK